MLHGSKTDLDVGDVLLALGSLVHGRRAGAVHALVLLILIVVVVPHHVVVRIQHSRRLHRQHAIL